MENLYFPFSSGSLRLVVFVSVLSTNYHSTSIPWKSVVLVSCEPTWPTLQPHEIKPLRRLGPGDIVLCRASKLPGFTIERSSHGLGVASVGPASGVPLALRLP